MSRLFAILLLAAVIAVSSAQYYSGHGYAAPAAYGYSGLGYAGYGGYAAVPAYGGYYGGLGYYKK